MLGLFGLLPRLHPYCTGNMWQFFVVNLNELQNHTPHLTSMICGAGSVLYVFLFLRYAEESPGDVGALLGVFGVPVSADLFGVALGEDGAPYHHLAVEARRVERRDGLFHAL